MFKFSKNWRAATAVAGALLTTAFAGPASASTSDFLGRWLSDSSDGPDLVRTVLVRRDRDGDRVKISLNDWGTDTASLFCQKVDCDPLRGAMAMSGKFRDNVHVSHLVLKEINDTRLSYELFVSFPDGDRSSYMISGTLVRANDDYDNTYDRGYGERESNRRYRRDHD